MKTFYNHLHHVHQGKVEMFCGQLVPCFEVPGRLDHVLARLRTRALGPIVPSAARDPLVLATVHTPRYLHFLEHAWDEWVRLRPH